MTEMLEKIQTEAKFNNSETFDIYRHCAATLIQDEEEGINLLIHILNLREKFSSSLDEMLADLVESIGFYPYLKKENLNLSSTSSRIRQVAREALNKSQNQR